MIKRRQWRIIPFLAFPSLAFVCDQGHAPAILNSLERPVVVSVQYRNAQSVSREEISILPGSKAWAPREAIALDEIEVRIEGKILLKLGRDELEHLMSGFPPGARVMWQIREDGVTPTVIPDPSG
jgi:hypothetical protein